MIRSELERCRKRYVELHLHAGDWALAAGELIGKAWMPPDKTELATWKLGLSTFVVKVSVPPKPSAAAKLLSDGEFTRVSTFGVLVVSESTGKT